MAIILKYATLPSARSAIAMVGFLVIGTGMGPVYPSIQHMAPVNFGRSCSASVIALQMASAYIGSTLMPIAFGLLQQKIGIAILPLYLTIFAVLNFSMLELAYRALRGSGTGHGDGRKKDTVHGSIG